MAAVEVDYETLLKAEGLAPLEIGVAEEVDVKFRSNGHTKHETRQVMSRVHGKGVSYRDGDEELAADIETGRCLAEEAGTALEVWRAWASGVLEAHAFSGPRQKRIWSLYASGVPFSQIAEAVGIRRSSVYLAIDRVQRRAPPPPVRNPQRKAGGNHRMLDYERIREAVAANPELLQLAQGDPTMANPTRKPVMYSQILLTRLIQVPGVSIRKTSLLNVEGTPHAGGIDVQVDGKKDGRVVPMVVTVPWAGIVQADRASEGE